MIYGRFARQVNRDMGALAFLGFKFYPAAMPFNKPLNQRETQSSPAAA